MGKFDVYFTIKKELQKKNIKNPYGTLSHSIVFSFALVVCVHHYFPISTQNSLRKRITRGKGMEFKWVG